MPVKPDRPQPAHFPPAGQQVNVQQPQIWAYWHEPAPVKPAPSPWQHLIFLGLGGGLVVLLAAMIGLLLVLVLFLRNDLIMPGVSVDGIAVGGHSTAEATALLQTKWQEQYITLDAGHTDYTVIPETLGVTLDAAATAQLAHRQGRSLTSLRDLVRSGGPFRVAPVIHFDQALAQKNLQTLAPQFELPAADAQIRLVNGRAEAVAAVPGQALDVLASMEPLVLNPIQVIEEKQLSLVMKPVAPQVTDVSGAVAQANQLLANPLSLRVYDPIEDEVVTWTVEPAEWSAWLSLEVEVGDPNQLNWAVNNDKAQAFLNKQAESLGSDRYLDLDAAVTAVTAALKAQNWPVQLRAYHHERQHGVQAGETLSSIGYDYGIPYPWIEQANPGISNSLTPGQTVSIPSPDVMLPLPVVENKRVVISLSQQKMWAYENGAVKWEWPVSTGIASSPTAPGIFQIQNHELNAYAANWNLWMPHFMGIYRPVPTSDFMNGFHGFPTRNGSTLLWTDDLGHPVTYGCILVSSDNAAMLYEWAEEGVVVEIQK